MTSVTAVLSDLEATRLASCEHVIERGLASFIEVGEALLTIRDNRLYRLTHATFEDYCQQRWNLSRKRAYDLTAAYEVVDALSPMGDVPAPANERQARELAALRDEPEVMRDVWREVVDHHPHSKLTAAVIKEKVVERVNQRASRATKKVEIPDGKLRFGSGPVLIEGGAYLYTGDTYRHQVSKKVIFRGVDSQSRRRPKWLVVECEDGTRATIRPSGLTKVWEQHLADEERHQAIEALKAHVRAQLSRLGIESTSSSRYGSYPTIFSADEPADVVVQLRWADLEPLVARALTEQSAQV